MSESVRFIEKCVEKYAEQAWRTAYVSLQNVADADDLLQQAFLVAWRKADSAPQERVWPWLAGIIVNEARNYRRKEYRRHMADIDAMPEPAAPVHDRIEQAELSALVHLALNDLTLDQRLAIVLTHLAGMSQGEAAGALGTNVAGVRKLVRNGLARMRELLGAKLPDLGRTLRELPVAAPPVGWVAAKSGWMAAATGSGAVGGSALVAHKLLALALWVVVAMTVTAAFVLADNPEDNAPMVNPEGAGRLDPETPPRREIADVREHSARPVTNAPKGPRPAQPPAVKLPPTTTSLPQKTKPPKADPPEDTAAGDQPPPAWKIEEHCTSDQGTFDEIVVDRNLPKYEAVAGVAGSISSVGSDTQNDMMTLWAEQFRTFYPNVQFSVEGKGSSTGPPALTDGSCDIAPMTRKMTDEEVRKFVDKFGYEPSHVAVAIDALTVYVHKDNPVECLSLPTLDAMFSDTRRSGAPGEVTSWGQLGLKGDWTEQAITLYGRNSTSGTYGYFKSTALFKGEFRDSVKEQPGSAAVVQSVSTDKAGIGYAGIGCRTAGVRPLPLSKESGETAYAPNAHNCYSGDYPLSRYLYLYFNRKPGTNLTPVIREFLKFVHSREGQEVVVKDGFIPLTRATVDEHTSGYADITD